MAYTNAKLEWSCLDCGVFEEHGGTKCRGIITGMIEPSGWGSYVDGVEISGNDWTKPLFRVGRLVKIELRKLKHHKGHTVTIRLTGARLDRVIRNVGMISDEGT
jgi:hypothetical protein